MTTFPFPDVHNGLVEVVLEGLVQGPDGTMIPGGWTFRRFVLCQTGDVLKDTLDSAMKRNAEVPSRLLFGLNPRSTRRIGDMWAKATVAFSIRVPHDLPDGDGQHERLEVFIRQVSTPGKIRAHPDGDTYLVWHLTTGREPRNVFHDLARLERGLGLEVSKEPSYMLPVPASTDWSRGEPREVRFVQGGCPGMFRNVLADIMDDLGMPRLTDEELATNPYRPTPIPIDEIPAGPHRCLVKFSEPIRAYSQHLTVCTEVIEGKLAGRVFHQKIRRSANALHTAIDAAGAVMPGRGRDIEDLIGHGADVTVEKYIKKGGRKKEKLRIAEWGSSFWARWNGKRGCLDADR